MRKSCGFCSFTTDDEGLFADHVFVAHGWGKRPPVAGRGSGLDPTPTGDVYCYSCGTRNPGGRAVCSSCGAALRLAQSGRRFGHAYALNQLATLRDASLIDDAAMERLRRHYLGLLTGQPEERPATPPAMRSEAPESAADQSVPSGSLETATAPETVATVGMAPTRPITPVGPGLFSPERAPSLLLYVGAFLIVVSALIFVNVSGQQISGGVKLVLLVLGTLGFLGVGLICHRYPRVLEAGRTFLAIGALLVPLDFAAYYVLITGTTLAPSVVWTLGSLVSAGLYGVLAMAAFGRLYAYLFLPAIIAVVAGVEWVFAVPAEWITLPVATVPMALAVARARFQDERVERLAAPLDRPGQVLAAIALSMSAAIVPVFESASSSFGPSDRRVLVATFAVATVYYGVRARDGSVLDRWRAALGPGAIVIAVAYTLRAPAQTFGLAFALLAFGYGIAADALKVGLPVALPGWLVAMSSRIALASAAAALLPVDAYWRAPFVGAIVDLSLAAGLAAVCVRRASERLPILPLLLATSAVAAHVGELLLLVLVGVIHAGPAPYTGLVGRELALAFAPLAGLVGASAWVARTRLQPAARDLALIALASAAATLFFAYEDPALATILASIAGVALVVAARAAGTPWVLWLASAAFSVAAISLDRWLTPPIEARPIALAGVALAIFVPASLPRWRDALLSEVQRQIGLATAAAAVVVGLLSWEASSAPLGQSLFTLPVWIATVPAVFILGAIGLADGRLRRSEPQILGSSGFFLGAVLMIVARIRPDPIEAYTVPIAVYFASVSWALVHWDAELRSSLEVPARVLAALALAVPTYAVSWWAQDVPRGTAVLIESVALLGVAVVLADFALSMTAIALLGLMALRAVAAPLAFESATAAFGVLLVGLGLAASRVPRVSVDPRTREAAELAASLLIVAPPLARAIARGPDALDQGASVLAASVVLVAVALWAGRRALLGSGVGAAALVGVLALPDSARAEPYVAATGAALLLLALAVGGVVPRRLPPPFMLALEITAAALALSGAAQQTLAVGASATIRLIAESLALIAAGLLVARPTIAYVGLGGAGLVAWWVLGDVGAREFHGIVVGATLVALSLYAARYSTTVLDARALFAMEGGGALLFIAPTLLAGWQEPFFPRTPMVFFEIFLVLAVGVLLHRRWLVGAAVAALGLETVRGLIDAVNRLPNYVLFAASGALLLGMGFVLLLKREAWNAWSARVVAWWGRL